MIKSQSDLNPCNNGKRDSEVLLETIKKCEFLTQELKEWKQLNYDAKDIMKRQRAKIDELQKKLDIAINALEWFAKFNFLRNDVAKDALSKIKE